MLTIYGADLSAPANKVRMTANALGLEYQYIRISIKDGENRTEEYLKKHPAGKVPVIDDDGFVLFESDAIIKYLAVKHESPLYPINLRERALVDQWMDFIAIHVGGAMGRVVFNRVFATFAGVPVDERSIKDVMKFLNRFLPIIDRHLSKGLFLAGDQFTLADIALLSTIDPAEVADVNISSYDRIAKWREGLRKEEFYTKCHSSYEEALKTVMAQRR